MFATAASASVIPAAPGATNNTGRRFGSHKIIIGRGTAGTGTGTGTTTTTTTTASAGPQRRVRRRRHAVAALGDSRHSSRGSYSYRAGGGRSRTDDAGKRNKWVCRSGAARDGDEQQTRDEGGNGSDGETTTKEEAAASPRLDYTFAYSEDEGDLDIETGGRSAVAMPSSPMESMDADDESDFASALEEVLRPVGEGEYEDVAAAAAATADAMTTTTTGAMTPAEAMEEEEAALAAAAAAAEDVEEALRAVSAAVAEAGLAATGAEGERDDAAGADAGAVGAGGRREQFAAWAKRLSRSTRERSKTQVRSATEALRLFYQARKSVPADLAKAIAAGVETTAVGFLARFHPTS